MKTALTQFDNETLQQIIHNSPDPMLITNKEIKIIYTNPAWEKLTGYTFEEVQGKNPRFLQSGKTPRNVFKQMWKTLLSGKPFMTKDMIDKKKNESEYQIYSNIYPINQNGEISHYVQLQHDITSSKRLDSFRKAFLSASAHELKTPVTVLKLLTQSHLYKSKKKGSDAIKTGELELIDKELDRLTRLINDMLDSSRFETGREFMTYEKLDLVPLIKKTIEKIQIYAKSHSIMIGSLPHHITVIADRSRIEQVLINLLSNAVKYSPNKTEITVSLQVDGKKGVVSVKDEGIGIPKNKQKLIFDRFYQVKAKSKIGFGLGLYISKEIIKRHKGKLWVESTNGKGSTFYFSLPVRS